MALDWLPTYPSTLPPAGGLGAQFGPPYGAAAFPAIPGWRPTFPDQIARRTFPAHLQLAFATGLKPIPTFPPTPLVWKPNYPDSVRRPVFLAASHRAFHVELQPVLPIPNHSWQGTYPDQLLLPRRTILTTGEPIFTAAIRIAPEGSWTPIYPDRIDRKVLPSSGQWSISLITPSPFPIPVESWQGAYPSQIAPRVSLGVPAQIVFSVNLVPIKNPPPNQAGLIPTYPNTIAPKLSLGSGSQREFTITVSPIPNAPAPTFSWAGIGPDRVPGALRVSESLVVYPFTVLTATPFTWMAQGPDPTRRVPPTPDREPFSPAVSLVPQPSRLQWTPIYPDRIIVASRFGVALGEGLAVLPVQHVADPTCIELVHHTLSASDLSGQTFGSPVLSGSLLGVSDLVMESLC